jgi:hypothetical protein
MKIRWLHPILSEKSESDYEILVIKEIDENNLYRLRTMCVNLPVNYWKWSGMVMENNPVEEPCETQCGMLKSLSICRCNDNETASASPTNKFHRFLLRKQVMFRQFCWFTNGRSMDLREGWQHSFQHF